MKYDEISFLPQEIITNIFKRLPVKSLIRLQCVCKYWKDLFKTSSFVGEHLSHSRKSPYLLFESSRPLYHLLSSFLDHHMNLVGVQSLPMIDSSRYPHIVGSCNGLICVRTLYGPMIIWNPSIGESIQVPGVNNNSSKCFISFGFDSTVHDYKIVMISCIYKIEKVQVYSLSTRAWKDVKFGNLDGVYLISNCFERRASDGVALCSKFYSITSNGAIFWLGCQNVEFDCVVSFDLALEVFTLIPCPCLASDDVYDNKLVVFQNNQLAILSMRMINVPERYFFDMWVMQESAGVSDLSWSWIKKYSSTPFPQLLVPRIIWKNIIVCDIDFFPAYGHGEWEIAYEQKVVLFNLDTQERKMVNRIVNLFDPIFIHVESLVSVHNNHLPEL